MNQCRDRRLNHLSSICVSPSNARCQAERLPLEQEISRIMRNHEARRIPPLDDIYAFTWQDAGPTGLRLEEIRKDQAGVKVSFMSPDVPVGLGNILNWRLSSIEGTVVSNLTLHEVVEKLSIAPRSHLPAISKRACMCSGISNQRMTHSDLFCQGPSHLHSSGGHLYMIC